MQRSVKYTAIEGIPFIEPGDDIAEIILSAIADQNIRLENDDIIVIAQKIVSKAQNRYVSLNEIEPSVQACKLAEAIGKDPRHIEVVLQESTEVLRYRQNVMIVEHRLGFVMANAGIDESNIDHKEGGRLLLLPMDPDGSCSEIKARCDNAYGVDVGVIINDSFGRPWRNGVVGIALGSAGLPSLQSMVGSKDLFGRALRITEIAIADELAAAASLLMGQGNEGFPVIHVRGFRSAAPRNGALALLRPKHMDLFR